MNADRIASWYRWLEYAAFGKLLERCRYAYVERLRDAKRVLIAGEGDGRFLLRLAEENRTAKVDVIESSRKMIALARRRVVNRLSSDLVSLHHCDARTAALPQCDAVVTHFFLDCFEEASAAAMVARIYAVLAPGGYWLLSEFRQPEHGLAAIHARLWIRTMYLFFRASTGLKTRCLPDYESLLRQAGMELIEERRWRFGLITAQLWRKPSETNPAHLMRCLSGCS